MIKNGLPFDHDRVAAHVKLGTTERWNFENTSGLRHRIHIRDVDWQVVSRSGGIAQSDPVEPTARDGETGARETFLVDVGETVEVVSTASTTTSAPPCSTAPSSSTRTGGW
jgi:FtsP/CotA-like multicopper oxidase with cupredoxin domain